MSVRTLQLAVLAVTGALLLAACGGSDNNSGEELSSCNAAADSACYNITFTGLWTATRHPGNFPSGAHFSRLVGATHKTANVIWARDGVTVATPGIESMAETGSTTTIRNEIATYIANGDALREILGGGIDAEDTTMTSVITSEAHSLISLTSMLAPSPDWFVGVRNVDLRAGGDWVETMTLDLDAVYDAGTDSGPSFTSANADVTPHLPIRLVSDEGNHFLTAPVPLGQIVITRVH